MTQSVKLIYLGDVFGKPGRQALRVGIPEIKQKYNPDLIFANCENAAAGKGISKRVVKELFAAGVDFMTSGNHIFDCADGFEDLQNSQSRILRPYNFTANSPGRGVGVVETASGVKVGVINLMGRVFMEPGVDLPFDAFDRAYQELVGSADILILDFHAEATSEKKAMGWHVDGKVQLMVSTHTHVQTADEEILPEGTAYISDLGMCGPHDSIIGMKKEIVLKRMRTQIPSRFEPAEDDVRLHGIFCEIDVAKKRALTIERIQKKIG